MPSPAIARLKKRRDFLRARDGTRAHSTSFVLQLIARAAHLDAGPRHDLRVGYTVTKKTGNSVERNRIKRRLREAVRHADLPAGLGGHDAVLIARREALDTPFVALLAEVETAFSKASSKAARSGVAKRSPSGQNPLDRDARHAGVVPDGSRRD